MPNPLKNICILFPDFTKCNSFEVIKNGVEQDIVKLDEKTFYLVGKVPDLCDIVLENPTISRKHAVI